MSELLGKHLGLPNEDYHAASGISNSGLTLIGRNPADYIWSQNAPVNPQKATSTDCGTAIHAALLEPELMQDYLVAPVKGRDTIKFAEFAKENDGKTVLTQSEYDIVRFSVDSAMAHPTIKRFLDAKGECESSIFVKDVINVTDPRDGSNKDVEITRKIRPDKDLTVGGLPLLIDVKKTASIADWRDFKTWKNPLFTYDYGHNAAYYLDTASLFYGEDYDEYTFILVQSTVELGKYPVTAMTITRSELEELGFFAKMQANLQEYATRKLTNDWFYVERFPIFNR